MEVITRGCHRVGEKIGFLWALAPGGSQVHGSGSLLDNVSQIGYPAGACDSIMEVVEETAFRG